MVAIPPNWVQIALLDFCLAGFTNELPFRVNQPILNIRVRLTSDI